MARTSRTASGRTANAATANNNHNSTSASNGNSIQQNVANASPTPFTISPDRAARGVLNFNVKEH